MDNELNELRRKVETKTVVNQFMNAYHSGDSVGMWKAMETAMANDERRAEAEAARRDAAVATLRAEPKPVSRYKVITLAGRKGTTLYVTGVSYKPGAGYQVAKVSYNADKAKAKEFSTTAAEGVAEYLVRCGYTVHISAK